jgi:Lon protease-like protein
MTRSVEIPLFPLNTVLFPGGLLPLRIFETRYLDMVRSCLREDTGFGVVLIRSGEESGDTAGIFDAGCHAKIVDFSQQPDGLLGIVARGLRRFRILETWHQPDGLNIGKVQWLPQSIESPLPAEFAELAPALENALEQAGEPFASMERHLDDCEWVAGRLAELLPIPDVHKQHCLELDDPADRLAYLRPMFELKT